MMLARFLITALIGLAVAVTIVIIKRPLVIHSRLRTSTPKIAAVIGPANEKGGDDKVNDDIHLSFAQENLLDGVIHPCGVHKCFYPVVSTASDDEKLGYIAGTEPSLNFTMRAGYEFATSVVRNKFGLQHTLVQPPETVELLDKPDLAVWMDQNKTGSADESWRNVSVPQFQGHDQAYVQLVHDISNFENDRGPAFFWRIIATSSEQTNALAAWLSTIGKKTARINFVHHFQQDVRKLSKLLKAHLCLYLDLQVYILPSGHIVLFDLDNCFSPDNHKEKYVWEKKTINYQNTLESTCRWICELLQPDEEGLKNQEFCS